MLLTYIGAYGLAIRKTKCGSQLKAKSEPKFYSNATTYGVTYGSAYSFAYKHSNMTYSATYSCTN